VKSLRVLFLGDLTAGTTSLMRFHSFQRLGHKVSAIELVTSMSPINHLIDRVSGKLFRMGFGCFSPRDTGGRNAATVQACREGKFDVLWLEKGLIIDAATLREARRLQPKCRIVGYSPDDMYARHNQSRQFLQSLPYYDGYFTTKSYGVSELQKLGVRKAFFVENAYDSVLHRPVALSPSDRRELGAPVGFIGTAEDARGRSMSFLAENGICVKVWGNLWREQRNRSKGKYEVCGPSQYGEEYVRRICAFDINLAFLRKINRDRQTTRSVEIPACGAFMLAERTDEHQTLFEEGKEAEYFDSDEELLDKVRYYLAHESERKRIAAAGRARCLSSGYSYDARIEKMLDIVMQEL
jgi:spore maturation protein CgeB